MFVGHANYRHLGVVFFVKQRHVLSFNSASTHDRLNQAAMRLSEKPKSKRCLPEEILITESKNWPKDSVKTACAYIFRINFLQSVYQCFSIQMNRIVVKNLIFIPSRHFQELQFAFISPVFSVELPEYLDNRRHYCSLRALTAIYHLSFLH